MLGSSGTDSSNEPGQPTLGCSTHSRELLKIGIAVSQATVAKYMARNRKPPSQTWRTFLQNHAKNLVAADFFEATEAGYRESCDPDQRAYNHGVDFHEKNVRDEGNAEKRWPEADGRKSGI